MEDCMKKLTIWYTKTFRPLLTHDELEPIMATLGFIEKPEKIIQNDMIWNEYVYPVGAMAAELSLPLPLPLPRPKLPSHRIDGLHIHTYHAFLDAVNFYLKLDNISDIFHIRGLPLHQVYDRNKKFFRMDENSGSVFVHREGTMNRARYGYYHVAENDAYNDQSSTAIRNKGNNISIGPMVDLKDLIVPTSN